MDATRGQALLKFINNVDPDGHFTPDDPSQPRVVVRGALELTREQEDALLLHADNRIEELKSDLGRDSVSDDPQSASLADLDTFMGRRRLFEMAYEKRWKWRKRIPGSIFTESNQHIPIIRRQVQQQFSRGQNYFFATEPFFSASPQGEGQRSEVAANKINAYAQWKFRQAGVVTAFKRAVKNAFIRGEGIVKVTPQRKISYYEDVLSVAVSPDGEPLYATDEDIIPEDAEWIARIDEETGEPEIDPETGAPVMVMLRDRNTVLPPGGLQYETLRVTRQRVIYNGPKAENVHYLDFLCPEEASSIQDADLVAHLYHMPAIELAAAYLDASTEEDRPRIADLIRQAAGSEPSQSTARNMPGPQDGESSNHSGSAGRGGRIGDIAVAECYLWFDANNDGREENIMLVYDLETKRPIFYDCLDRISPKGIRPFFPVRVNPVENRWYGQSQVDMFWDLQMDADLAHNRRNFSQSQSGTVKCVNWEAVYEGAGTSNLELNTKKTYRLKDNKSIEDFVQTKPLHDYKYNDLKDIIEFNLQLATTLGGVANANDNSLAGLDTTKLATGVRNIERSGQEQFAPLIGDLEEGLTEATAQLVRLLGPTLDHNEVFEYFDGKEWVGEMIQKADLANNDYTVEMQLTRYRNEQQLAEVLHSLDIVDRFYAEDPQKQTLIAPLYRKALQLFNVDRVDQLIVPGYYLPPGGGQMDPAAASAALADPTGGKSEANL